MIKITTWALAGAACLMAVSPALAARHRHHLRHAHHAVHARRLGVIRDVLVANPYGDVIIDGRTGFHRSDWGVMVPDTEPPSFVATGRAYGSGLGANGLPGQNWQ